VRITRGGLPCVYTVPTRGGWNGLSLTVRWDDRSAEVSRGQSKPSFLLGRRPEHKARDKALAFDGVKDADNRR